MSQYRKKPVVIEARKFEGFDAGPIFVRQTSQGGRVRRYFHTGLVESS